MCVEVNFAICNLKKGHIAHKGHQKEHSRDKLGGRMEGVVAPHSDSFLCERAEYEIGEIWV